MILFYIFGPNYLDESTSAVRINDQAAGQIFKIMHQPKHLKHKFQNFAHKISEFARLNVLKTQVEIWSIIRIPSGCDSKVISKMTSNSSEKCRSFLVGEKFSGYKFACEMSRLNRDLEKNNENQPSSLMLHFEKIFG